VPKDAIIDSENFTVSVSVSVLALVSVLVLASAQLSLRSFGFGRNCINRFRSISEGRPI